MILFSCGAAYGWKSKASQRCRLSNAWPPRSKRSTALAMQMRLMAALPGTCVSATNVSRESGPPALWFGLLSRTWSTSSAITTIEGPSCDKREATAVTSPGPELGPWYLGSGVREQEMPVCACAMSASRFRRPVGDRCVSCMQLTVTTCVAGLWRLHSATAARTERVLPVPGPPETYRQPPLGATFLFLFFCCELKLRSRKSSRVLHSSSRATMGYCSGVASAATASVEDGVVG